MKLKRKVLIVGGTMLFGVPACSGDHGNTVSTPGQEVIPRDSMLPSDGAAEDSSVLEDSGSAADQGISPEDMMISMDSATADASPPLLDGGGPDPDAMLVSDSGLSVDQGALLDAVMPFDMAVIPDAAENPDQGMAGACAEFVGAACEGFNTGCCENGQPVLFCRQGQFVNEDIGLPCDCRVRNGVGDIACAVPGFVGIHLANRQRVMAPRLRDLLT